MASKELTTVMEELTRQGALNRREHRLNRRAYEEGMALCAQMMDRNEAAFQETVRAIREMREETRAQTRAIFKVIDRMDRLDGGAAA